MTDLVEELLLLARLDEGRSLDRAPVDLSRLVVDAVADAHVAGPAHRWSSTCPTSRSRYSATSHACTRSSPICSPTPARTLRRERPCRCACPSTMDAALLVVLDDGPGIPPDLLPEVFDRFARADTSRSRTAGSTGLGLAIVQAVVRAHDGQVDVTSARGGRRSRCDCRCGRTPAPAEQRHLPGVRKTRKIRKIRKLKTRPFRNSPDTRLGHLSLEGAQLRGKWLSSSHERSRRPGAGYTSASCPWPRPCVLRPACSAETRRPRGTLLYMPACCGRFPRSPRHCCERWPPRWTSNPSPGELASP